MIKAHPEFHRKDIKNNTWEEVAEALGTNGKIIKSCFFLHYNPCFFWFHLGRKIFLCFLGETAEKESSNCSSDIASSYFFVQVKSQSMLHHGSVGVSSE